jgi:hypothetical protein
MFGNPKAVDHIPEHRPPAYDGRARNMGNPSHEDVKNGVLVVNTFHKILDARGLVLVHVRGEADIQTLHEITCGIDAKPLPEGQRSAAASKRQL